MYRGKDPGANFINNLRAAFVCEDPKSAKKTYNMTAFFALLGSASAKAAQRRLMILTPEGQLTKMYFCEISKIFLLHVCLVSVHVPKFYWHKTSVVKVSISPTFSFL